MREDEFKRLFKGKKGFLVAQNLVVDFLVGCHRALTIRELSRACLSKVSVVNIRNVFWSTSKLLLEGRRVLFDKQTADEAVFGHIIGYAVDEKERKRFDTERNHSLLVLEMSLNGATDLLSKDGFLVDAVPLALFELFAVGEFDVGVTIEDVGCPNIFDHPTVIHRVFRLILEVITTLHREGFRLEVAAN